MVPLKLPVRELLSHWLLSAWVVVAVTVSPHVSPGQAADPSQPVRVTLLDGKEFAADTVQVKDGRLSASGLEEPVPLDEVRRIQTGSRSQTPPKGKISVLLTGGGRIMASDVGFRDDQCILETEHIPLLKLPIDAIRAVVFADQRLPADYQKALAKPSHEVDRIFLEVDKKPVSVSGLIEAMDDTNLRLEFEGATRPLPRSQLVAIVVAQADAIAEQPPAMLLLADGSQLGGELTGIADGVAVLEVAGDTSVEIPWPAIRDVVLRSDRLAFLSDLEPIQDEQQPIVTLPRGWQRDRSFLGNPLTLGGKVYDKGIGVHSRSLLTFNIEGKYDQFAAVVGIDAETGGKGNCVFKVLGDGKPLWTQVVTGNNPPRELQVDIRGVRELTLLVEPGEDLDLADHADWCDARLIRSKQ